MKVISAAASVALVLTGVAATEATTRAERELIVDGETVPASTKTYNVGLRSTAGGKNFCGGTLISPTHVLTSFECVNTTISPDAFYELTVIELERASSFTPVKLAEADDSDIKKSEWATSMGWGYTSEDGPQSEELQQVDVEIWTDKKCSKTYGVDETMVCAGGTTNGGICGGDNGGPLVIESETGDDSGDVLVAVAMGSEGCGKGYTGAYARVSPARDWLDEFIGGGSTE